MAYTVFEQGDAKADNGSYKREYPIEDKKETQSIIYDKEIQQISYIQGNIVGVFNDWILSFFPSNYFRHIRIKTQSTFSDFKSWMKNIYKKDKPLIVIDPANIEVVEDFLFGQNMLGRYNMIDPLHDNIGAKLIYSRTLMKSDRFELVFRRNRYRFEMNIMIMEQTMNRQLNTYNAMIMNIRHNSKFMLPRRIPHLIPIRYIQSIAKMHDYDWRSEEFLTFLNEISEFAIIKRVLPNGTYMFFFEQDMNIQVEVPGYPNRDTPEMSNAIEWGARITDSFILQADLPSEYLCLIPEEEMTHYDKGKDEDPESVYLISPVYADLDWPEELGDGFRITNRVDITLQDDDDPSVHLLPLLNDYSHELYDFVFHFIEGGNQLSDLMKVVVYPNGSYENIAATLDNDGTLTLHNPKPNKIYTANIYINFNIYHIMKHEANTDHIGTIEKY